MQRRKEMSTGTIGLVLTVLGATIQSYVRWISPPPRGLENLPDFHLYVGIVGIICLLVGACVCIVGIQDGIGVKYAVLGLLVSLGFFAFIFLPMFLPKLL